MSAPFIGRQRELQSLNKLFKKNSASLVVIQGRRRIGKSRLVEEFAKQHVFYQFSGIMPTDKTTPQSEREEFARQLHIQTKAEKINTEDWSHLFFSLADKIEKIKAGHVVVLFDEITWMGSKDPDFLGKVKHAWDVYFKKNPRFILILCGSISVWIDKNILSSTGFVGRISYRLTLDELPLNECNLFLQKAGGIISPYEKLKILSVIGGVPRYLEEIKPTLSAEENIKDLCFTQGGALFNEFNEIFSDLFSKRSGTYKKIIQTLSVGALEIKNIAQKLNVEQSGFLSHYLDDLIKSGFITRDYTWHLKSSEISRLSHFRLSDNYLRFYLKYMDKQRQKIDSQSFAFKSLSLLPQWEAIMGLQFENLVLKNRFFIKNYLGVKPDEIVSDNPFFQRQTTRVLGCQIDYLIQANFGTLYVCEIKFKKYPIGLEIISEMQKKLSRFSYPRGFSCRPVLIHVNGVREEVAESGFFSAIVDFTECLTAKSITMT